MGLFGIQYEGDTQYGHYQVSDVIYNARPARVLFSGDRDAAQSGLARDGKPGLLFDYTQRFMELIQGIRPRSILHLGGGAMTMPTAVVQQFPEAYQDIVELDDGLVGIAEHYFEFKPDEHTQVHIGDAREFLDAAARKYDMILVDVFSHDRIPDDFQSGEFAASLQAHLNPDGVAAMNIISALEGSQAGTMRRIHANMRSAFADVRLFPARNTLPAWSSQNVILTAQNGSRDVSQYLPYPQVEAD